jgi:L-idonate 5-dehydrogenase
MAAGMDDSQGAMMEPLAVALHAVKRAGAVAGRGVLITGGGPIGLLTLAVARACGAVPVVLTDLVADRRSAALNLGADAVLDPSAPDANEQAGRLVRDGFDVVFEASGAPPALRQAIDLARPGGTIVQIGTLAGGDVPLPANQIMARELQYIGSFRYGNVFDEAIRLVQAGRIDLRPFVSRVWPLRDVEKAIRFAAAREQTIKVQVAIDQDRERA